MLRETHVVGHPLHKNLCLPFINLSRLLQWKLPGFGISMTATAVLHPSFENTKNQNSGPDISHFLGEPCQNKFKMIQNVYFTTFFQSETSARTSARVSPITSAFVSQVKLSNNALEHHNSKISFPKIKIRDLCTQCM